MHLLADLSKMLPTIPLTRIATQDAAKFLCLVWNCRKRLLIFDAFDGPKAFFSDRRAQKNGFKNVSSHKPFSEYDETVLGYQKLKKSVRGLLCREKLENGKKSTVRDL